MPCRSSARETIRRKRNSIAAAFIGGLSIVLTVPACAASPERELAEWWEAEPIPAVDVSFAPDGLVPLPEGCHPALRASFAKYTNLVAPNGKPIHFLAEGGVSDEVLVRARELARFFLTDVPGSVHGADKAAIANAMADRRATLACFSDAGAADRALAGPLGVLPLYLQSLCADASVVEGSSAYLDGSVRDTTLQEVFHLVYGAGIHWARRDLEGELEGAMRAAIREGRWSTRLGWVLERSSAFEYATNVLDVHYGLWAHDPEGTGASFGGEYRFCDRAGIERGDPLGVRALRTFLPDALAFACSVAPDFEGDFSLAHDPGLAYTEKSRYLVDVRLTGTKPSGIVGNERDNVLAGNAGDNRIDGGGGHDAVRLAGSRSEYDVSLGDGVVVVSDRRAGRDGTDVLLSIECLHFADGARALGDEPCPGGAALALAGPLSRGRAQPPEFELDLAAHIDAVAEEIAILYDADGDGILRAEEVPADFRRLLSFADVNADGSTSRDELAQGVGLALAGPGFVEIDPDREVQRVFANLDANGDGRIEREELPEELLAGFDGVDANGDGAIVPSELLRSFARER